MNNFKFQFELPAAGKNRKTIGGKEFFGQFKAFTLIELIAVVVIVGILVALVAPVVSKRVMEAGNRAKCTANLKTLASGVFLYVGDNNGRLPYSSYVVPPQSGVSQVPWMRAVSPYLVFDWTNEKWRQWTVEKTRRGLPSVYYCPSDKGTNETYITPYDVSYGINVRVAVGVEQSAPNGDIPISMAMSQISKPAQIILLGDSADENEALTVSKWRIDHTNPKMSFSKRHAGGANIAWCDGHVSYENEKRIMELQAQTNANSPNWGP